MCNWPNSPPPEWQWIGIVAGVSALATMFLGWGFKKMKRPMIRITHVGIYDGTQRTESEGVEKWWYITVENRKRWGFIKTSPAEDCEIRFWFIREGTCEVIETDGYKGRWDVESWVEETESKRTLRVGVPNNIPVIRISSKDEPDPRRRLANTAYITETIYFISDDKPLFALDPGKYAMLLVLSTGASKWMEEILSLNIPVNIPERGLDDFELKRNDRKKLKNQSITKKQFHDLHRKVSLPAKKKETSELLK